jgi:hypothetical protein
LTARKKERSASPKPDSVLTALGSELAMHSRAHSDVQAANQRVSRFQNKKKLPEGAALVDHSVSMEAPIWSLSLRRLQAKGLQKPTHAGWLVLFQWDSGLTGLAEVRRVRRSCKLRSVSTGGLPLAVKRAHSLLRRASRGSKVPSEFRVLRVPALYFFAVWLHFPSQRSRDYFVPVMENFIGLKLGKKYARQPIQQVLKKTAREVLRRSRATKP